VSARQVARLPGDTGATTWAALLSAPIDIPSASLALCPNVEVLFARGTTEPPGIGGVGQAAMGSLRSRVAIGPRSLMLAVMPTRLIV
jgi:cutinase